VQVPPRLPRVRVGDLRIDKMPMVSVLLHLFQYMMDHQKIDIEMTLILLTMTISNPVLAVRDPVKNSNRFLGIDGPLGLNPIRTSCHPLISHICPLLTRMVFQFGLALRGWMTLKTIGMIA
tara:strand:+ start:463 stop:825 length:363 start_codon:yes stop_codon:yes gene_type:complete